MLNKESHKTIKGGNIMKTINIYTGREEERKLLKVNKHYLTLEIKEFRTGKDKFYYRPTVGYFFNDYLHERVVL